jgi:hypothetical protein
MTTINITAPFHADSLADLFQAGIDHSLTFSNFSFDADNDLNFDAHFPTHLTNDDLRAIFRDYQLDSLADYLVD